MALAETLDRAPAVESEKELAALSFNVFYLTSGVKAQTMVQLGLVSDKHLIYSAPIPSSKSNAIMRRWLGQRFDAELKKVAKTFAAAGYPVCKLQSDQKVVSVFVSKG